MDTKQQIIEALRAFARQRSGMDWRNYEDAKTYRAEQRSITRDRHYAETLISAIEWRDISAEDLISASKQAFSGRLTIKQQNGAVSVDYCTGQYFPTEYRKAVAAVCASALWGYIRGTQMPEPTYRQHGDAENRPMQTEALYDGVSAGAWLRRYFRREFGRGIASRYFD